MEKLIVGAAWIAVIAGVGGMVGIALNTLGAAFDRDPLLWALPAMAAAGGLILYNRNG